jgi:tetratricopeptide (TPR) repeat protein
MANELQSQLKNLNIDFDKLIADSLKKVEDLIIAEAIPEAELIASQLLRVVPDNIQALQLYGLVLLRLQKYAEATEVLDQSLQLDAANAESLNNLALCYLHTNKPKEAYDAICEAVSYDSNNFNFYNNAGIILRAMGKNDEAIETFRHALKLKPDDVRLWENLGSVLGSSLQLDKAIECFHTCLKLNPDSLSAKVDLAYAYHLKGEWEKAWPYYEFRLKYWHQSGRHTGRFYDMYPPAKAWDGSDLSGKTICLYCEQGFGDLIQFIRFAPFLKSLGATVVIDAPPSLASLFAPYGIVRGTYTEDYDVHCSVLSLPYLLKLTPEQYWVPYLFQAQPVLDMKDYAGQFKIGVVWAGNPGHPNDANRSCHLKHFREMSKLPGVTLFSFQKEKSKRAYASMPDIEIDLADNCDDMRLIDMSEFLTDFQATANLLKQMDLIICVDTSVLHLAGALEIPVWGLLAFNPDWRWTIKGDRSVWYPSLRLFRQSKPGDWDSVFAEVIESLPNLQP